MIKGHVQNNVTYVKISNRKVFIYVCIYVTYDVKLKSIKSIKSRMRIII